MSFTDLLTISMPVYERKDFFEQALDSALNQTVKCKVIVSDNCSSHDFFEKICKEKGVTYYRNETNIGMAGNFAKGFERAETPYVLNLQDDDQLDPHYVEAFVKAHEKHPDIDIFFSDFVRLTSKGQKPHRHTLPFGYMPSGDKIIEYGIKYNLGFPYIASAIKKEAAKTLPKYSGFGSYDWVWIYSEAEKFSFYGDSRKLYIFRDHDNQDTKNNSIKYSLTRPYIFDEILKPKVNGNLSKEISAKVFWELVKIRTQISKKELDEFMKEDEIYGNYIKNKLKNDNFVRTVFLLPGKMVDLAYRSLRKLSLIP